MWSDYERRASNITLTLLDPEDPDNLPNDDHQIFHQALTYLNQPIPGVAYEYLEELFANFNMTMEERGDDASYEALHNNFSEDFPKLLALDQKGQYPPRWEEYLMEFTEYGDESNLMDLLSYIKNIPFRVLTNIYNVNFRSFHHLDEHQNQEFKSLVEQYYYPRLRNDDGIKYMFNTLSNNQSINLHRFYPSDLICKLKDQIQFKCDGLTTANCRNILNAITEMCQVKLSSGESIHL